MTIRHDFPGGPQPRRNGWPIVEMSHGGRARRFAHNVKTHLVLRLNIIWSKLNHAFLCNCRDC